MVNLIIGKKGTGKTKQLIDRVNAAVQIDKGHLVFINNGQRHVYDLDHKIRLIDTSDFKIDTYQSLYGLLCGVMAQDYDISNIFIDSITKIIPGQDIADAECVFEELEHVAAKANVNVVITASIDVEDAPEYIKKYL